MRHAYEVCPARRGGWDVAAQAPTSPEHPAPTGSVAIVQPGQGDLGAPPQLVGMYEVVQALLGLLTFGPYAATCAPAGRD